MNKYIFIDRDGTIIKDANYLDNINDIIFFPNSIRVLGELNKSGYNIVIVTNQSGIGRGFFNDSEFHRVNNHMIDILKFNGVIILETLYCPHTPSENCGCRKPKNGLFEKFKNNNSIDLKNSWMIGDKFTDVEFGKTSNLNTILFDPSLEYEKETQNHYHAGNYLTIKKIIIENEKR